LKPANPVVVKERRGVRALKRPDQVSVYDVAGIMSNVMAKEETGEDAGRRSGPAMRVVRACNC